MTDYLAPASATEAENQDARMQCCLLHIGLMHIRYYAFIGNLDRMNNVAVATERLL